MQIKHGYKSKFAVKNELVDCEECDEKVKRKNLSLHKFKNHEHNLCFCCGTKFEDFELFTLHQSSLPENKTEQELYSCDKCEFKCSTPGGLKRHFSRNHETNKKTCPECGFESANLRAHRYLKHRYAKRLREKIAKKKDLKQHLRKEMCDEEKLECKKCDYKAKNQRGFDNHVSWCLTDRRKKEPQQCPHCEKKTPSLKAHIYNNHTLYLVCKVCSFRATKYQLDKHMKEEHPDADLKKKCPKCDAKVYNLKSHMDHLHNEKFLFQCKLCEFKTVWNGNLTQHMESKHKK